MYTNLYSGLANDVQPHERRDECCKSSCRSLVSCYSGLERLKRLTIMMKRIAAMIFVLLAMLPAWAAPPSTPVPLSKTKKDIETLGTGVAIALPLVAGGISYFKHDRIGLAQLTVETALKSIVREQRPDGSDFHSFPSGTTALAASGSSYLWGRYGWQYGLPAFFATQFVSYSRIQAKQHHWYDTLASSAIAAGYGYVLTTPFKRKYNINTELEASPEGGMIHMSYNF
jgi:membrane-associated phospholipid phosphatase